MKELDKKLLIAQRRIKELNGAGDMKALTEQEAHQLAGFYRTKCNHRLETAKLLYMVATQMNKNSYGVSSEYQDFAEVVAACYYSMYYIVHAYVAKEYRKKLRVGLRGVHAITHQLVLFYLIKTKNLAEHLYEDYISALATTARIQQVVIDDFEEAAYSYAQNYDRVRGAREDFTYTVTISAERRHAQDAIRIAEEFINTIKQLIL